MSTILTVFFSCIACGITLWGLQELRTHLAVRRLVRGERKAQDLLNHMRERRTFADLEAATDPSLNTRAEFAEDVDEAP